MSSLSSRDLFILKYLVRGEDFAAGYDYLSAKFPAGSDEHVWYTKASEVNAGLGLASAYARAKTDFAGRVLGYETTGDAQQISDDIARSVIVNAIKTGSAPDMQL